MTKPFLKPIDEEKKLEDRFFQEKNETMHRMLRQLGGAPLFQTPYYESLRKTITPKSTPEPITLWVVMTPDVVALHHKLWNLDTPQSVVAYVPKVWNIYHNATLDNRVEITKLPSVTTYHILSGTQLIPVANGKESARTYQTILENTYVPPSNAQLPTMSQIVNRSWLGGIVSRFWR